MKSVISGLGLMLSGLSAVAMAGGSTVSIGAIGSNVNVSTLGDNGSNQVSISGDSIRVGAISSVVGKNGGSSAISIGSINGAQESKRNKHSDSFVCNESINGVNISGDGQHSEVDGAMLESMCVSGTHNRVVIANSDALELVSLSGVSNTLRLSNNASNMVLQLGGTRNKVYLPHDAIVQVIRSGIENQVIRF